MLDVVIVGAGPAGLSAALILGRCRRHVLLCDSGEYRNAHSHALHGFLTRDGTDPAEHQRSDLAAKLGCDFTQRGVVRTGEYEETTVPGLFVAGDASRRVQLAIVAAAEGAEAAFAINSALLKEDLRKSP